MVKARLLRQVDDDDPALFSPRAVAVLDKDNNLVSVRRSWWEQQCEWVRRAVWKMDGPYYLDTDFERYEEEC